MTYLHTLSLSKTLSVGLLLSLSISLDATAQSVVSPDPKEGSIAGQHVVQHLSIPKDFEQFAVYWTEEPAGTVTSNSAIILRQKSWSSLRRSVPPTVPRPTWRQLRYGPATWLRYLYTRQ
jgi:hypothetical protein